MQPWRRFTDAIESGVADPHQLCVLMILTYHWNERERLTWPSPETIAKRLGMSERKVRYVLRKLEADGRITSVGSRKGGRGKSIRYRLNLPCLTGNPAQRAPFTNEKPCTDAPETRHGSHLNPAQHAPEPLRTSLEPGARAGAALEGAPPRARNRAPEGESPQAKRRRQLIDLAPILGIARNPNETMGAYLARLEHANEQRLARVAG